MKRVMKCIWLVTSSEVGLNMELEPPDPKVWRLIFQGLKDGDFCKFLPIRYLASHILTPHIISAYSSSMDAQALGYYIAFDGLFSLVSVIVSLYFLQ